MMDLSEKLSPNFTLGELLRSDKAEELGLVDHQHNPPADVVDNLRYLCTSTLQPIRDRLGFPIRITSGYRSPAVNQAVGGAATSQHLFGQAADAHLPSDFLDPTNTKRQEIAQRIQEVTGRPVRTDVNPNFYLFAFICLNLDDLDIDQVIHEFGAGFGEPSWVHLAASRGRDRRQILALGGYVTPEKKRPDLKTALAFGV
ncbi:MAG: D-Ala-D-Ala carboxypeptidase family metallohydrolase [Pseudomonadota bacterium]